MKRAFQLKFGKYEGVFQQSVARCSKNCAADNFISHNPWHQNNDEYSKRSKRVEQSFLSAEENQEYGDRNDCPTKSISGQRADSDERTGQKGNPNQIWRFQFRSEEHTSELQSRVD